ncbi:MAG TPA: zinc-binding dehydrogenase [Pseudomonadota bacterium]|jgi:NADPH:quinone reductase-like Zn-dependent oxidoreductase|nr:zinc-binding dehydrogenase [Deltaproteobacteria bacterium]HPH28880.1 zinc-binding dehydrogenase [Pseudomonadota bacterium]
MEPTKSTARDLQILSGMSGVQALPSFTRASTMKALELRAYDGVSLVFVSNKPVPVPAQGEVLVKVHSAPVSAADLLFLQGRYGEQRPLPVVPGSECSGIVVSSGGGLLARALLGRRVACGAPERGDGTWAEYVCVPAWRCVPLRSFISFEQGAPMLHTAIGAWALLETARSRGAHAIAHTAGDSAMGRMLVHLSHRRRQTLLHIVDGPAQAQALRTLGARHVVDMSGGGAVHLTALFAALGVQVVLEANAGVHTDALLRALPRGGSILIHGARPESDCTVDPSEIIYGQKSIEGFFLADWIKRAGFARTVQAGLVAQRILNEEIRTEVSARLALDSYHQALDLLYRGRISDGQVQFTMSRQN